VAAREREKERGMALGFLEASRRLYGEGKVEEGEDHMSLAQATVVVVTRSVRRKKATGEDALVGEGVRAKIEGKELGQEEKKGGLEERMGCSEMGREGDGPEEGFLFSEIVFLCFKTCFEPCFENRQK
jgi:hypothetical protein